MFYVAVRSNFGRGENKRKNKLRDLVQSENIAAELNEFQANCKE